MTQSSQRSDGLTKSVSLASSVSFLTPLCALPPPRGTLALPFLQGNGEAFHLPPFWKWHLWHFYKHLIICVILHMALSLMSFLLYIQQYFLLSNDHIFFWHIIGSRSSVPFSTLEIVGIFVWHIIINIHCPGGQKMLKSLFHTYALCTYCTFVTKSTIHPF